jgi:hypothetical protein
MKIEVLYRTLSQLVSCQSFSVSLFCRFVADEPMMRTAHRNNGHPMTLSTGYLMSAGGEIYIHPVIAQNVK